MAGAHARVAGLLAAADLQLRPRPHRRRRAVRVRRPGRGARHLQAGRAGGEDPETGRRGGRREQPRVRTEPWPTSWSWRTRPSAAQKLLDAIRERARAGRREVLRRRAAHAPAARQRDLRRGRARLRAGARGPRARVHARGGHRRRRRGRRRGPVQRRDGRRAPSTASTRSSSRTLPAHLVGLAAARPARARSRRPACRSSTSCVDIASEGLPFDGHARGRQPDRGGRRAREPPQAARRGGAAALHRRRPAGLRRRHGGAARRAGGCSTLLRLARARPASSPPG